MFILVIACVSSLLAGAVPDPVWASYAPRRAAPPDNAAGYRFQENLDSAEKACKTKLKKGEARETWLWSFRPDTKVHVCRDGAMGGLKVERTTLEFRRNKLVGVEITFSDARFHAVERRLVKKYGPPDATPEPPSDGPPVSPFDMRSVWFLGPLRPLDELPARYKGKPHGVFLYQPTSGKVSLYYQARVPPPKPRPNDDADIRGF